MSRERRGTMQGFAKRLDDLILASGYTYKQVADRIGKERKSIYAYKTGDTIPDGVTICKLCFVLRTTPNYLLLGKE